MDVSLIANLAYIVSAVLFVFGLKMLGSPATARRGNMLSSIGMLIAVVAGLSAEGIVAYKFIAIGMVVGAIIGASAARLVAMTSMPEMVALFNGSGGVASLLVGWGTLYNSDVSTFTAVTIVLAILIGGVTFTGSFIAWGKLSETIGSAAVVFTGQRVFNSLLLVALLGSSFML
ncbi:MAG TPA: NAD(P)(+) transhydrogenase (Re/Si-specific) subunit beta, partial [Pseudomonadales bacterium]|nr:NAD(P)(+) transhydrogenase (Re/Si-specific) subunit beta [Pseudomonadales bacterium]